MRLTRASATAGKVHIPMPVSRRAVMLLGFVAIGAWVCYSFAEEALLNQRLHAQAAELQRQNGEISRQNDAYRRDLTIAGSPGAGEETVRQYGYARPGERVYVVSQASPSPAAAPATAPSAPARTPAPARPTPSFWTWIQGLAHVR